MKALRKMICFILLLAITVSLCACEEKNEGSDTVSKSTSSISEDLKNDGLTTIASSEGIGALWNKYVIEQNVEKIETKYRRFATYLSSEITREQTFDDEASIGTLQNALGEIGDAHCHIIDSLPDDFPSEKIIIECDYFNGDKIVFSLRTDIIFDVVLDEESAYGIITINDNIYFKIDSYECFKPLLNLF